MIRVTRFRRLKDRGMFTRKGETCFWDRVTHIRIRDCPLIPIACAMQSVAPRCNAVAARPLSRRPQTRK